MSTGFVQLAEESVADLFVLDSIRAYTERERESFARPFRPFHALERSLADASNFGSRKTIIHLPA